MADDGKLDDARSPPAEITRALFDHWREARTGDGNPARMTNPVWTWLVRQPEVTAYAATRHFTGQGSFGRPPGWTNHRFGQSTTSLPDGRTLAIAGEHEDSYDPDFYIYNDVIVTDPDGGVEIYGYPRDLFPATDFHSATLRGDHVWLIGNLGYPETRGPHTQVLRLDVHSLAVERIATTGDDPGWISRHVAEASADGDHITVRRGRCEVDLAGGRVLRDNVDDHVLDLTTLRWTRTTDRRWIQYTLERGEGIGQLWEIGQLADYAAGDDAWSKEQAAWYRQRLTHEPDLAAWRARFQPPIAHVVLPSLDDDDEDAWRTHRIHVDGVTVRYVDGNRGVQVVIEGPLAQSAVEVIVEDLRDKLARADHGPYLARRLG